MLPSGSFLFKLAARPMRFGFLIAAFGMALLPPVAAAQERVTFAEVLAAPDDLALNLAYARQQIAAGDLQEAATTLERMLLLQPDWDEARLVYGIVLYRLRDLAGAVREFEVLADRNLSPSSERERRRYLALAQEGDERLRVFSEFAFGAKVASNPGRAPENAALRPVIGGDGSTRWAGIAATSTTVEYDLANGRGDYVFARSRTRWQDFVDLAQADFLRSTVRLGGRFHGERVSVEPFAHLGTGYQHYDRFLSEYGGGVNFAVEAGESDRVRLFAGLAGVYEDFDRTDFSSVGSLRDGWRVDVHGGARWRVTDANVLTFIASYTDKDAEDDGFAFERVRLEGRYLALLGEGLYFDGRVAWSDYDYDGPDPRFGVAADREDEHWRFRAAVGAPLETLFSRLDVTLPDAIGEMVLQVGTTYTTQDSNIAALDVDNWTGDVMLIKRVTW